MTLQKYEKFSDLQIFFIVVHIGTSWTMLIKVYQKFPVCLFLQLIELLVRFNACRLAVINPSLIFPPVLLTFTCILCVTGKVRAWITTPLLNIDLSDVLEKYAQQRGGYSCPDLTCYAEDTGRSEEYWREYQAWMNDGKPTGIESDEQFYELQKQAYGEILVDLD